MNPEDLAPHLYARWCDAMGGKDAAGKNLPMWAEFIADAANSRQVAAWTIVAVEALAQMADAEAQAAAPAVDRATLMRIWESANALQLQVSAEIYKLQ